MIGMYLEYVMGYATPIAHARLGVEESARCYVTLARWAVSCLGRSWARRSSRGDDEAILGRSPDSSSIRA